MGDLDFTGLTPAQRKILDRGGWTVDKAGAENIQPGPRTVAKLIARGLVTVREYRQEWKRGFVCTTPEYIVPDRVRAAWSARKAKKVPRG